MTVDDLRAAVTDAWLAEAVARVRRDPDDGGAVFAQADRRLGRGPLPGVAGWTTGQAGRAVLLAELSPGQVAALYRQGDTAERLAVLKALPLLAMGDAAAPLVRDALRCNDARLVAAALGPCAAVLDQAAWRQGVVKCVFLGVALDVVHDLSKRADADLIAILAGLAEERAAAGRPMPADAAALVNGRGKTP